MTARDAHIFSCPRRAGHVQEPTSGDISETPGGHERAADPTLAEHHHRAKQGTGAAPGALVCCRGYVVL